MKDYITNLTGIWKLVPHISNKTSMLNLTQKSTSKAYLYTKYVKRKSIELMISID